MEDQLTHELLRPDGPSTILVVGGRGCGKTHTCESAFRVLGGDHRIIRWTPDDEYRSGTVARYFSEANTIVFVDDADVLVRVVKGSSIFLQEAMRSCENSGRSVRIVMTALSTKGRVWRAVAGTANVTIILPDRVNGSLPSHMDVQEMPVKTVGRGWMSLMTQAERAVASREMKNWCMARLAGQESEGGEGCMSHTERDDCRDIQDGLGEADVADVVDAEGGVVWAISDLIA